jgi:ABC-2 type transport system ATP-binding protein
MHSQGNEAAVEARALRKVFSDPERGTVEALRGLDLECRYGEIYGLLGPNGAGKTTTLRILTGLLVPSEGKVAIDGLDLAADPVGAKSRFGFVSDGAPLYANLSARAHLLLVGRLAGLDEAKLAVEAERLLAALDLADRADDPIGGFSRGMRQKAALACALIAKPKLLILDEPLTGLDAPTAAATKAVLRAWADRGGAVLYTSHLLDVVERVCDRVAILNRGELVAAGTLDELRARATRDKPGGTLEEVFGKLTASEDPSTAAARVLGQA